MDRIIDLLIRHRKRIELPWNPFTRRFALTPTGASVRSVRTKGEEMTLFGDRRVAAVLWQEGLVTVLRARKEEDLFSFEFGGCVMARYKREGSPYVAHIHTDTWAERDCRDAWIDYAAYHGIGRMKLFRPEFPPNRRLPSGCEVWGIISAEGNCYSAALSLLPRENCAYRLEALAQHFPPGNSCFDYRELCRHGGPPFTAEQLQIAANRQTRYAATSATWRSFFDRMPSVELDIDFDEADGCCCPWFRR